MDSLYTVWQGMHAIPTESASFEQPEGTAFTWCNLLGLCLGWPCLGLPCCYCPASEAWRENPSAWFVPPLRDENSQEREQFTWCTCVLMFCVCLLCGVPWCFGVERGCECKRSRVRVAPVQYALCGEPEVWNSMG